MLRSCISATASGQRSASRRRAGRADTGVANVWPLDIEPGESNGDLLASTQDPLVPATLSLIEPGKPPEILKRAPRTFDAQGLTVTRHEARSEDGTRIPYLQ